MPNFSLPLSSALKKSIPLLLCLLLPACQKVSDEIAPQITYSITEVGLASLPGPFAPLSTEEKNSDWGKEYQIGIAFAKEQDGYRAITAFKRASILLAASNPERKREIEYDILLTYYFAGNRPEEVIRAFKESSLADVDATFPAYRDLAIILHESYLQTGDYLRADNLLQLIEQESPQTGKQLYLSEAMTKADFPALEELSRTDPDVNEFLNLYYQDKKSPATAQALNAFIPGTGYFYLGQVQSGFTSLFLNTLFITAACLFFQNNNPAAGVIAIGFETGWYFGGIYGAGLEAKLYNERVYERHAYPFLQEKELFPGMMLRYAF